MRFIITLLFLAIVWCACKKGVEPGTIPDPPVVPIDSTLTTDSSVVHLDALSLSNTTSFKVKYVGNWSIAMNPSDTNWLYVSKLSGTGVTDISVKATKLNLGSIKRSTLLEREPLKQRLKIRLPKCIF